MAHFLPRQRSHLRARRWLFGSVIGLIVIFIAGNVILGWAANDLRPRFSSPGPREVRPPGGMAAIRDTAYRSTSMSTPLSKKNPPRLVATFSTPNKQAATGAIVPSDTTYAARIIVNGDLCEYKPLGGCPVFHVRFQVVVFVANVGTVPYPKWAAFHNRFGYGGQAACLGYNADFADVTQACEWRGSNPASGAQYVAGVENISGTYGFGPLGGSFSHTIACHVFVSERVQCYYDGQPRALTYNPDITIQHR